MSKVFELDVDKVENDLVDVQASLESLTAEVPTEYFKQLIDKLSLNVFKCSKDMSQRFTKLIVKHVKNVSMFNAYHPQARLLIDRILMRLCKKGGLPRFETYQILVSQFACEDKSIRSMIQKFIVSDMKQCKLNHTAVELQKKTRCLLGNWITQHSDNNAIYAANILVRLYRKNIMSDQHTINILAECCFHKSHKVKMAGLTFLLNKNKLEKDECSSESETEETKKEKVRRVQLSHRVGKKSQARQRHMEKELKNIRKKEKSNKKNKKELDAKQWRENASLECNVKAFMEIWDVQRFADRLLPLSTNKRIPLHIHMLLLEALCRLVGSHKLMLPNLYVYLLNKMNIKVLDVTKYLVFAAQASHDMVAPDDIEPLVKKIADEFVNEGVSGEAMALGLNTIRKICERCPYAIGEELLGLIVQYKSYRDKNVAVATRGLIRMFREVNPGLLPKEDQGRPTEATVDKEVDGELERIPRQFGETSTVSYIPGGEFLVPDEIEDDEFEECSNDDDFDDDDEWVDVIHSSDDEDETAALVLTEDERAKKSAEMSVARIWTDDDLKKIRQGQAKKQMQNAHKKKQSASDLKDLAHLSATDGDSEWVTESDITHLSKKRKSNKAERLEAVEEGREDRPKFGFNVRRQNPNASTTNREKSKKKNFMMVRDKIINKKKYLSVKDMKKKNQEHITKLLKFMRS